MTVLNALPTVAPRKETVAVPEWGGSVIVRGLLASEVFAVTALRQQALRRVRREVAERKEQPAEGEIEAADVQVEFDELRSFGRYMSQLLSLAVVGANGLALWTVDDWEAASQTWPDAVKRLLDVAERLSGMVAEDVRKNSTPSQT